MDPSQLGPAQRAQDLDRASDEEFDLVIVGGGVVGAGTALDAETSAHVFARDGLVDRITVYGPAGLEEGQA